MIRYNKLLFIIVIISLASFSANAQQGNTMYYIDNVPQSNELNPARQHRCKVHLGCPALSQIYFTGENTGFTYNDIVQSVPGNNDEIVLFLNEQGIGKDEFLSDLPKVGYASVEASSRMASLGLRLDRYYFTFNINQKFFGRFSYPKEYFSLLLEGNVVDGQYQSYDLSNLAVDIKSYREYALGVSEQINDQWNFGVRLKILFGQFNFNLENNSKLQTTQDQWILPKDALNLNTSIPGVEVTDSSGMLEEVKTTEAFEDDAGSFITDEFLSHKNLGVAIDFGAIYRMNDQFEFSLSILDIGSISWKNNVANMSQKAEFNFEGYRIATLDQDSIVERDFVDELVDSAGFEVTNESYTTGLPAKIYLGGRWFANEVVSFGILSKTEIYHGRLRPQVTFSGNLNENFISAALSYTIMNRNYNHIGFGINFKIAPFNLFIISDNIPLSWNRLYNSDLPLYPYDYKTFNIRFGLSLLFGCKDPRRDTPLIF